MATTVDELLVRIKADTKGLETALGRVKAKTNDTFKPSIMDRFKRSLGGMRGAAIAAGAALATIAAVKVARVGAEFESLRLSLQQVTGSAVAGDAAFRQIQGFAQESPFQIKDLTKAFIQLKTAGIEPTQELFTTFSDASSVAVDSLGAFQAMVRITQRSAGGGLGLVELEQISDRGIPVYEILTKKLGRTREQLSEMGKSAEGAAKIMKALNEGMQEQFGGATALKMETLNQKLSNMSDAFDSLADVIFNDAGLGGALKFLVDQASAFATFISEGIQMMATGNSRDFVQAKTLEGKLNVATAERETIGGMSDSVLGRLIQDGILTGELAKKGGKESELERLDAVIASIKEQIKERDRLAKIAQEAAQREADQKRAAVAAAQAQDAANEAREQSIENLGSILSEVRTPAELLQEKIEQINAELILLGQGGGGEFTEEQLIETLRRLSEETSEAQEKTQELAETLQDKLLTAVVENVNKFTTDFVMALVNGQNALESFKNFSKQIVSQIIATFMQMLVINKIIDAIGMALAQATGQEYNATTQKLVKKPVSTTTIPNTAVDVGASGGAMRRGQPFLVGERGPELFVPHTAGTLRNGNDTRSMGGAGIVINQSINLTTGVAATVRSEVTKMMPTISEVTKASVLEAASRGGKFKRGLMGA